MRQWERFSEYEIPNRAGNDRPHQNSYSRRIPERVSSESELGDEAGDREADPPKPGHVARKGIPEESAGDV